MFWAKVPATDRLVASVPGKIGPPALSQSLNGTVKVKPLSTTVCVVYVIVGGSVIWNAGGVYWNGGGSNTSSGGVPPTWIVSSPVPPSMIVSKFAPVASTQISSG